MDFTALLPAIVGLVFFAALFTLLREVVMWYWKINRMVELQEQQLKTLLEIYKLLKKDGEGGESAASHSKTYLAALQKKQSEGGESAAS